MTPRRLFVAGSTGAVGTAVIRLAAERGDDAIAHARPKPGRAAPPGSAVVDLGDTDALAAAMAGVTTVLQLIGTMRHRFAAGDTYETSDIGTTQKLVDGARRAGCVDHFVLLSSVGAGGVGAYLKAKARAEAIARESGIPWTIFRPSAFDGTDERRAPPLMRAITGALRLHKYHPIRVDELASALLRVARERAPLHTILEGKPLFALSGR